MIELFPSVPQVPTPAPQNKEENRGVKWRKGLFPILHMGKLRLRLSTFLEVFISCCRRLIHQMILPGYPGLPVVGGKAAYSWGVNDR